MKPANFESTSQIHSWTNKWGCLLTLKASKNIFDNVWQVVGLSSFFILLFIFSPSSSHNHHPLLRWLLSFVTACISQRLPATDQQISIYTSLHCWDNRLPPRTVLLKFVLLWSMLHYSNFTVSKLNPAVRASYIHGSCISHTEKLTLVRSWLLLF